MAAPLVYATPLTRRGLPHTTLVDATLHQILQPAGYQLLIQRISLDSDAGAVLPAGSLRGRVDGVVALSRGDDVAVRAHLGNVHVPVVLLGSQQALEVSSVRVDVAGARTTAVRHLLELGHSAIALIGDFGGAFGQKPDSCTVALLDEAGTDTVHTESIESTSGDGIQAGSDASAWLALNAPHVTAVVVASDELAWGVVEATRRAGKKLPQDMSLIVYGGHELSDHLGLTAVLHPVAQQVHIGGTILLRNVSGAENRPVDVCLPALLRVRSSTMTRRTSGPSSGWKLAGAQHSMHRPG